MFLKIVGHVYKLSRPQIMVNTEDPQQLRRTFYKHTHIRVSLTEKPLETTLTESATFLKKFPDMSFSAHPGQRGQPQQPLTKSTFHHSETESSAVSESSSQQHTHFPPNSISISEDIAVMLLCREKAAGKTRKGESSPTWTPGGTQ